MQVFLHTFGCKANQYDTETVRQAIESAGARITADPSTADAAVINSCTVTREAEAKMRGMVRRIARARPGVRTVVMGCAAALDDGTIAALPGVTDVVAGGSVSGVMAALDLPMPADRLLRSFQQVGRGWLRIQDGCDEHCTFCATTRARGASRSRPVDDIVAEARLLSAASAELVITGIHIGSYGLEAGGETLGALLQVLVSEVPTVRFRLSSLEATEVDEEIERLMVERPDRLAPHLHAPLQSGSDRVLRRMGRHWYSARTYQERIERLASELPVFGLGADVMVGFPDETDGDHRATVSLIESLPFTYLHVFPYSERPGTAASRLGQAVEPSVVAERSAELRELGCAKQASHIAQRAGSTADLVVTGRTRGRFTAMTEDYLDVAVTTDEVVQSRFDGRLELGSDGLKSLAPRTSHLAPQLQSLAPRTSHLAPSVHA